MPVACAEDAESLKAYMTQHRVPAYRNRFDPGSEDWSPDVTRNYRMGTALENYLAPPDEDAALLVNLGTLEEAMQRAAEQAKAQWMAYRSLPVIEFNVVPPLAFWKNNYEPAMRIDAQVFTYPRPRDGWPDEEDAGELFHIKVAPDVSVDLPTSDSEGDHANPHPDLPA